MNRDDDDDRYAHVRQTIDCEMLACTAPACAAAAAPMARSGRELPSSTAAASAASTGSCICSCWPSMRAMCRCVTCAISCASTEASSDSVSAALIRPVCTPTNPPGRANALSVWSRMTKNSKSWRVPGVTCARRSPSPAR